MRKQESLVLHVPVVSQIEFDRSTPEEAACGLLGWVYCVVDGFLALDGIELRLTLDRKLVLKYPGRADSDGKMRPFVRSLGAATVPIEEQVFRYLRHLEVID